MRSFEKVTDEEYQKYFNEFNPVVMTEKMGTDGKRSRHEIYGSDGKASRWFLPV